MVGLAVVGNCSVGNYPTEKVKMMAPFPQFHPIHGKREIILLAKILNCLLTSKIKSSSVVSPITDYPAMAAEKVGQKG